MKIAEKNYVIPDTQKIHAPRRMSVSDSRSDTINEKLSAAKSDHLCSPYMNVFFSSLTSWFAQTIHLNWVENGYWREFYVRFYSADWVCIAIVEQYTWTKEFEQKIVSTNILCRDVVSFSECYDRSRSERVYTTAANALLFSRALWLRTKFRSSKMLIFGCYHFYDHFSNASALRLLQKNIVLRTTLYLSEQPYAWLSSLFQNFCRMKVPRAWDVIRAAEVFALQFFGSIFVRYLATETPKFPEFSTILLLGNQENSKNQGEKK